MASSKPDLARAGTMQVTAKEGEGYLDRTLTEWKKTELMDHFPDGEEEEEEEETAPATKKPKMSKHSTMKGTAKEAAALLGEGRPDDDAGTRGQQKKLEAIKAEKPAAKKAKLARDSTMAATAKEAKGLLAGEKLADTRTETKKRKSKGGGGSGGKRLTTADKILAEAKVLYSDLDQTEGRSMRKRAAPKPTLKKAGTMQNTAKEGKAFLKRGKKSK